MACDNNCSACILNEDQHTLITLNSLDIDVLWVGLSAKKQKDGSIAIPLSPDTNTGRIIQKVELGLEGCNFAKTNLVKCAPLDKNDKLRYPTNKEMNFCYHFLVDEINDLRPKIVFLLGLNVANFVLNKNRIKHVGLDSEYNYANYKWENIIFIPIHHPSFIHIYKRKQLDVYVEKLQNIIFDNFNILKTKVPGIAS